MRDIECGHYSAVSPGASCALHGTEDAEQGFRDTIFRSRFWLHAAASIAIAAAAFITEQQCILMGASALVLAARWALRHFLDGNHQVQLLWSTLWSAYMMLTIFFLSRKCHPTSRLFALDEFAFAILGGLLRAHGVPCTASWLLTGLVGASTGPLICWSCGGLAAASTSRACTSTLGLLLGVTCTHMHERHSRFAAAESQQEEPSQNGAASTFQLSLPDAAATSYVPPLAPSMGSAPRAPLPWPLPEQVAGTAPRRACAPTLPTPVAPTPAAHTPAALLTSPATTEPWGGLSDDQSSDEEVEAEGHEGRRREGRHREGRREARGACGSSAREGCASHTEPQGCDDPTDPHSESERHRRAPRHSSKDVSRYPSGVVPRFASSLYCNTAEYSRAMNARAGGSEGLGAAATSSEAPAEDAACSVLRDDESALAAGGKVVGTFSRARRPSRDSPRRSRIALRRGDALWPSEDREARSRSRSPRNPRTPEGGLLVDYAAPFPTATAALLPPSAAEISHVEVEAPPSAAAPPHTVPPTLPPAASPAVSPAVSPVDAPAQPPDPHAKPPRVPSRRKRGAAEPLTLRASASAAAAAALASDGDDAAGARAAAHAAKSADTARRADVAVERVPSASDQEDEGGGYSGKEEEEEEEEHYLPMGLHVLIADPAWVARATLRHDLSTLLPRATVAEAETGERALQLLSNRTFDIAILCDRYSAADSAEAITGAEVTRQCREAEQVRAQLPARQQRGKPPLVIIGFDHSRGEKQDVTSGCLAGQDARWCKAMPPAQQARKQLAELIAMRRAGGGGGSSPLRLSLGRSASAGASSEDAA